jgi:hypothetical protein
MGERLREGYLAAAERQGIDAVLLGPPARMSFDFRDQVGADGSYVRGLFLEEILAHGILTDGNALASYAHTDETVDESITRFERALAAIRDRLDREAADPPCPPARRPRSKSPARPPLPDRVRRRLRAVRGVRA